MERVRVSGGRTTSHWVYTKFVRCLLVFWSFGLLVCWSVGLVVCVFSFCLAGVFQWTEKSGSGELDHYTAMDTIITLDDSV